MTQRIRILPFALVLLASACAGAEFERAPSAQPHKRLSIYDEVRVVARPEELPAPVELLGTLKLAKRAEAGDKAAAQKTLQGEAARRGCNAIAGLDVAKFDTSVVTKHKVILPGGSTRIEEKTEPRVEYQWSCQCVFWGTAPVAVAPVPAAEKAKPVKDKETAKAPPPPPTPAPPPPAPAAAAAAAPPPAAVAAVAPTPSAAPAPTPAPSPAPTAAPAAAPKAAAAPAPAKAAPAPPPPTPDKAAARREGALAAWDNAIRDGSPAALLDFLARYPEAPEVRGVQEALIQGLAEHTSEWLVIDGIKAGSVEIEKGPELAQATLQQELTSAGATSCRVWTPKEYSYRVTLRNPTRQPVLVEAATPAGRLTRLLGAGKNWSTTQTAACTPLPQPQTRAKDGLVLDLHFGCAAEPKGSVTAVWPAKREAAVDKKAVDGDLPPEVLARVWHDVPDSTLTGAYLTLLDEALARRSEDLASVRGKVTLQKKASPDAPTLVTVSLKNGAPRDVTVVFEVTPGREERLAVPRGGSAEVKLEVGAAATPELHIRGVLPRLRSADWLVGNWSFGVARLVILPSGRNGFAGFAIEAPATPGAPWRVTPVAMKVSDGSVTASGALPGAFARALFGAATPAACDAGCDLVWTMRLSEFDRFVLGAGRVLPLEVTCGELHGRFEFAGDH